MFIQVRAQGYICTAEGLVWRNDLRAGAEAHELALVYQ